MTSRPSVEHLCALAVVVGVGCTSSGATSPELPIAHNFERSVSQVVTRSVPQRAQAPSGAWVQIDKEGAPRGREDHTAVWTGSEMIVWGGEVRDEGIEPVNSGARYNPQKGRWKAMTLRGAPDRRDDHVVVWTGSEMIVWGGNQIDEDSELLASGGRYDPRNDRWAPTANGPLSPRDDPTAVWTGSEMIVWGGRGLGSTHERSGARYNPASDTWKSVALLGAPGGREDHTAVWTGKEMLVWGGWSGRNKARDHHRDGARYDPSADAWKSLASDGAPEPREDHTAVWTGTEMIVWGGVVHKYAARRAGSRRKVLALAEVAEAAEPDAPPKGAPSKPRDTLVQLATGGRYDLATDSWKPMSLVGAPAPREDHIAVWLGDELLVWGGRNGKQQLADGAIYNPSTDTWRPASTASMQPTPRWNHTAVVAGDQVLVWGGFGNGYETAVSRYQLASAASGTPEIATR